MNALFRRAIEALARAGDAKNAGVTHASCMVLRLPHGLRAVFDDWLPTHQPMRRDKVIHRLESPLRAGRQNDPRFEHRIRGEGNFADQIGSVFRIWTRELELDGLVSPRALTGARSWPVTAARPTPIACSST